MNLGSVLIYVIVGGITVAQSLVQGGQSAVQDSDKTWTVLNATDRP